MNLRRLLTLGTVHIGSGLVGSLAGFLVSLPFTGPAYVATWFGIGVPVAAVAGFYAESLVEKKGWL